jgi:hypothetical protein
METRLNSTYLRPGPIARAAAVAIAAAGIGAGVLFVCWGASLLLHDKPRTDVAAAELELLKNVLDQLSKNNTAQAVPEIVRTHARIMLTPATTTRGKASFAATWTADVDIDVYVRCSPDLPYLAYSQTESPEGHHVHDWQHSPGPQAFEVVDITRDVTVPLCDFYLNLYAVNEPLHAPPAGKVRIAIMGNIWEAPFQFPAGALGNQGAGLSQGGGMEGPDWLHVNIRRVLGMERG